MTVLPSFIVADRTRCTRVDGTDAEPSSRSPDWPPTSIGEGGLVTPASLYTALLNVSVIVTVALLVSHVAGSCAFRRAHAAERGRGSVVLRLRGGGKEQQRQQQPGESRAAWRDTAPRWVVLSGEEHPSGHSADHGPDVAHPFHHDSSWRFGGLAVWRFGGLAVWRFGGLAVWRLAVMAVWRFGGPAVWRFVKFGGLARLAVSPSTGLTVPRSPRLPVSRFGGEARNYCTPDVRGVCQAGA